jgi:MFS family permease
MVFFSMLAFGIGVGGIATVRNALQLDFFGLEGYAVVQGLLVIFVTVGFMAAPPLAGWVFDSVHTYRPAWIAFSALSLISIPLILGTTKPKEPLKPKDGEML